MSYAGLLSGEVPQARARAERRRIPRIKVSAPVHVRSQSPDGSIFAEICNSVDVSSTGLYFITASEGYRQGADISITFPYSEPADIARSEKKASVLRVLLLEGNQRGIAVRLKDAARFATAGLNGAALPLVLVVEPDQHVRMVLKTILEKRNYAFEAVANSQEALDALLTKNPAVIVAELEAEDMSGCDFCACIKSDARLRPVPVVMVTRRAGSSEYSSAHAAGASVCMAKPYKPERLLHVVQLLAPAGT